VHIVRLTFLLLEYSGAVALLTGMIVVDCKIYIGIFIHFVLTST